MLVWEAVTFAGAVIVADSVFLNMLWKAGFSFLILLFFRGEIL